jgi:hypothetical protein
MSLIKRIVAALTSFRKSDPLNIDRLLQIDGPNYADQHVSLQDSLGDEIFVAAYQGVIHEGQTKTFSVWTDCIVTALPKTDFIWLQDAEATRWFVVPWLELEAAVGTLRPLEGVEPPRFLTPMNIPVSYFLGLEKSHTPPPGFPVEMASGYQ